MKYMKYIKSKKTIIGIIAVAVVAIVLAAFAIVGIFFQDFNAQQYVSVLLKQSYYGEVEETAEVLEGATEEELYAQYEAGVTSFAKSMIPGDAEIAEELQSQYIEIGKKIFKAMKFSVKEEEKQEDGSFEVLVTYQPSDAIVKYMQLIQEELTRMNEKVEKGEYQGTVEEINAQMQQEFLENACTLLEEACDSMEYGEKQEMIFHVIQGENDLYQLTSGEMQEFLEKILRLDEIQD